MVQNVLFLAVFNSAHRVMKAEHVLKQDGLAILLIPAPRALSTDCGLAIRYDGELFDRVLHILQSENLLPAAIYRKKNELLYEIVWDTDTKEPNDLLSPSVSS